MQAQKSDYGRAPSRLYFQKLRSRRQVPGQLVACLGFSKVGGLFTLAGWREKPLAFSSPAKALITTTHPYTPTGWSSGTRMAFGSRNNTCQTSIHWTGKYLRVAPKSILGRPKSPSLPRRHLRAYSPRHERGVQPEIRRAESRDDGDDVYFVQ